MAPNPAGSPNDELRRVMSRLGKRGGRSRAKKLSSKRLSEIGRKGGKASGRARRKKSKKELDR